MRFNRLNAFRLLSTSASASATVEGTRKSIPITVISGFLGAGKTTFLQQVLDTSSKRGSDSDGTQTGKSFGLLVNDVASLNVDAKLLKNQSNVDTLELENGCICCTLAEDMIASVAQLLEISKKRESTHDHIVLECSGIAEPRNIRDIFRDAAFQKHPLPEVWDAVHLDTFVTVIDATVFLKHFGNAHATLLENPHLVTAQQPDEMEGGDGHRELKRADRRGLSECRRGAGCQQRLQPRDHAKGHVHGHDHHPVPEPEARARIDAEEEVALAALPRVCRAAPPELERLSEDALGACRLLGVVFRQAKGAALAVAEAPPLGQPLDGACVHVLHARPQPHLSPCRQAGGVRALIACRRSGSRGGGSRGGGGRGNSRRSGDSRSDGGGGISF